MIMGMSSGLVLMRFSLEAKNLMAESWESKRGELRSMKGLVGLLSEVLGRGVLWSVRANFNEKAILIKKISCLKCTTNSLFDSTSYSKLSS